MVRHTVEEVAKAGCRVAVRQDANEGDVLNVVDEALAKAGIADNTVTVGPNPPSSASHLDSVSVKITVSLVDVAWLPSPRFMSGKSLARCW